MWRRDSWACGSPTLSSPTSSVSRRSWSSSFPPFPPGEIQAVAVSTRPRAVEGSYMPCFLAGVAVAKSLAAALSVPCHEVSHQQGHVAAALWSAGRMDLMDKPHLAWHLSGGTTELLSITPEGKNVRAEKIGGTSDISAGQIMDRTGKLLAPPLPRRKGAGSALPGGGSEALPGEDTRSHLLPVGT